MAEILLVNPSPRKRKKSGKKRKMSALQRKYFGGGRKRRARATNTRRRRSVARVSAPRRRKRSVARLINPQRRSRRAITAGYRRRRINPSLRGGFKNISGTAVSLLKSGGIGALGALGLDVAWGYGKQYLPAGIAGSPLAQYATKLLGAILVGMIGDKVLRGRGKELATGAATVVLHDALKAQVAQSFPGIPLGEYLTFAPTVGTMDQAGRLLSTGMGEYLSGLPDQIGYPANSGGDMGDSDGSYQGDGMNGY